MTQTDLAGTLARFEGLVLSTSRMFAGQVRREEEDLAQELRIRVWRAIETHDPSHTRVPLERYVFYAISNKMRDFKRDAAREKGRREREGLSFLHIEDLMQHGGGTGQPQDWFDALYHHVTREDVYGHVESEPYRLDVDLTSIEQTVLVGLFLDYSRDEIAAEHGIERKLVDRTVASLRRKLADKRPAAVAA